MLTQQLFMFTNKCYQLCICIETKEWSSSRSVRWLPVLPLITEMEPAHRPRHYRPGITTPLFVRLCKKIKVMTVARWRRWGPGEPRRGVVLLGYLSYWLLYSAKLVNASTCDVRAVLVQVESFCKNTNKYLKKVYPSNGAGICSSRYHTLVPKREKQIQECLSRTVCHHTFSM